MKFYYEENIYFNSKVLEYVITYRQRGFFIGVFFVFEDWNITFYFISFYKTSFWEKKILTLLESVRSYFIYSKCIFCCILFLEKFPYFCTIKFNVAF